MTTRTYLRLYFGTQSLSITEVAERLAELDFIPSVGKEDFYYEWKDTDMPRIREIFALGDKIVEKLKGTGCVFKLRTG